MGFTTFFYTTEYSSQQLQKFAETIAQENLLLAPAIQTALGLQLFSDFPNRIFQIDYNGTSTKIGGQSTESTVFIPLSQTRQNDGFSFTKTNTNKIVKAYLNTVLKVALSQGIISKYSDDYGLERLGREERAARGREGGGGGGGGP